MMVNMRLAELAVAQAPFIESAEVWSGQASVITPTVGRFVAERLWNTLEATVLTAPAEPRSSCALGIPWFDANGRRATLLLSNATVHGTLEVWHVDSERNDLRLSSGYFGAWNEFKRITALTRFRQGEGLPGRVWQTARPVLLEDLGESKAFLRAEAARSVGLCCGLGIPVRYPSGIGVVVFLSSLASPLGRAIDLWRLTPNLELEHLQGLNLATSAREHALSLAAAQPLVNEAATLLTPTVLRPNSGSALGAPIKFGFAWPSVDNEGVVHVASVVG